MYHYYIKRLSILLFMCCGWAIQAQEICDNGIDDDVDGLIDLNDPECICQGIVISLPSDILPNSSFEDRNCCPENFSDLKCVNDWQNGNSATADYLNTCGFILPALDDVGLEPFPEGEGIAGMVFSINWMEYLSVCLNETLPAGITVTMTFWVAVAAINNNGTLCNQVPEFGPVNLTIYGAPDCNNLKVVGTGCPSDYSPSWMEMGFVSVEPATFWHQVILSFTPTDDITAIMLGAPCMLPEKFGGTPCYAYYVIDGIVMEGEVVINDIPIVEIGQNCTVADTLTAAFEDSTSGFWQWYYEGVALLGQTTAKLPIAENDYQTGNYQVVFTTTEGCATGSILVDIPTVDTAVTLMGQTLLAHEQHAGYQWVDCDNGYEPIPGETDSLFIATEDGHYAVILSIEGCVDTSSCYHVMTVGINETVLSNLRVYPNPTSGEFTIEFGQDIESADLETIDVFGRITSTKEIVTTDKIALTLTGTPGMYWVRLYSEGEMLAIIRVMKE